ncbi:hypothetical protein C6501_19315 [Candidatus Poribacteria bacterium]|nr:MAG: hypothetical protein C6501_19315 [Candidatus Poribacteria bacterium]
MKIKVFLILLVTLFTSITFKSHTQLTAGPTPPFKFKVCVTVIPQDETNLDENLEIFIRRELRALGDVDLVKEDSDWHFHLAYNLLELKNEDGTKSNFLSIASVILRSVLVGYDPEVDPYLKGFGRPGYLDSIIPAYYERNLLHRYAIVNIGDFDKARLERLR